MSNPYKDKGTSFPSNTAFAFFLGAALICVVDQSAEILPLTATLILQGFTLLIPSFSLLLPPINLTIDLLWPGERFATINYKQINIQFR